MKIINSRFYMGGLVLMLALSSVTFGQDAYWGINGGLSMASDSDVSGSNDRIDWKDGWVLGAVGGYDFGDYRLEGEFSYQKDKMKDEDIKMTSMSAFFNGYYDIETESAWTPFVGGGLGLSRGEVKGSDVKENDTVFAWHLDAGISYAVSDTVSLEASYRYLALSDLDFDGTKVSFDSNNILFGVKMKF